MAEGGAHGWSPAGLPPPGPVARPKASLRVGQRARRLGTSDQLGVIRFIGEVDGRAGLWVGLEWDELGRGDTLGELNGRRYFVCSHRGQKVGNAASFVRESEVFVSGTATAAARGAPRFPARLTRRRACAQRTRRARRTRRC